MKKNKGFSLIELLVVISIIGVLTTVLVMNFVGARERSRDAQRIQNLNSLKNALRMYYNDNQTYPASMNGLVPNYVPSLGNMSGISYVLTPGGDGFKLTVQLEVGAGDEGINSQKNCGIPPVPGFYSVCAN